MVQNPKFEILRINPKQYQNSKSKCSKPCRDRPLGLSSDRSKDLSLHVLLRVLNFGHLDFEFV